MTPILTWNLNFSLSRLIIHQTMRHLIEELTFFLNFVERGKFKLGNLWMGISFEMIKIWNSKFRDQKL